METMDDVLFAQERIDRRALRVVLGGGAAAVVGTPFLLGAGLGRPDVVVFVLVCVAMVVLMFGLPLLRQSRRPLVVDRDGVWIDGELAVPAGAIRAVAVHAVEGPHAPRARVGGEPFARYRVSGLGDILAPASDRHGTAYLWDFREVVVAVDEDVLDGPWTAPAAVPGRVLVCADDVALARALVACAPAVTAPVALRDPVRTPGLGRHLPKEYTGEYRDLELDRERWGPLLDGAEGER